MLIAYKKKKNYSSLKKKSALSKNQNKLKIPEEERAQAAKNKEKCKY